MNRFGRGRAAPPEWVNTPLPQYTPEDQKSLRIQYGTGWQDFNFKTKEEVKLQKYTGPPATAAKDKISITVNHFPLKNFKLPKNIYHYEVTFERVKRDKQKPEDSAGKGAPEEPKAAAAGPSQSTSPKKGGGKNRAKFGGKGARGITKDGGGGGGEPSGEGAAAALPPRRLPKPLPQLILQVLLDRLRRDLKFYGIVSDLSNNIYSTKRLEDLTSMVHEVCMTEVDQVILQEKDDGKVKVTITPTQQQIDTTSLSRYLQEHQGSLKGMDLNPTIKTSIEMVYNAVVKSMPKYRFLPLGKSNLVTWPLGNGRALDWQVEVWKGITANIHMGWKPYFNVDSKLLTL
jgi:hypothetical protein